MPCARHILSAALAIVGLLNAAPAAAQTFSRTSYQGMFQPLVADFNGDGRMDIVGVTSPFAGVMLNNGGGAFAPQVQYPLGGAPHAIDTGDINGDGRVDLVVAINNPQVSLSLLIGNGDGTFQAPVTSPNTIEADSPSVAATDLDNDGRLDIVAVHSFNCYGPGCFHRPVMSVRMGNGDGTFQPPVVTEVGTGMAKIAVGDFNRDGAKDLAIAAADGRLFRLQGNGDGTFTQLETITLTPMPLLVVVADVDVADFNRDGIEDLVAPMSGNASQIAVLIGKGDGTFQTPLILDPGRNGPQTVAVADYNGDTFLDLAYGYGIGDDGLFAIRNGNGDGTFQAQRIYEVPPPLSSIGTLHMTAGNLNGDSKPDLVLAVGGASHSLRVLLNTTGTAPPPTPGTPTLLSPAAGATVALPFTFDWTDVANAARYRIQIDDESNFASPLFDRETSLSQFESPSLNARRHWWRVRAINSAGVAGAYTGSRRFTVGAPPPATPAAPTLIGPANGATVAQPVTLDWFDVPDAANYRVQIDDSSSFTSPLIVDQTVSGSQFAAPTLPATTHWWRVRGVNSAGTAGPFSVVRSFTPQGTAPPPPPPPPPPPTGGTATLTVSASGRSGERVLSSPSGINVAVPGTQSAPFTTGTSITMSASNGRDVIWSGACSSGGQKTRNCTFTLNAAGSITANVQ